MLLLIGVSILSSCSLNEEKMDDTTGIETQGVTQVESEEQVIQSKEEDDEATQETNSNEQEEEMQEAVNNYNNEEFNISFNYPTDWTIEKNEKNKSVIVASPSDMDNAGNLISIRIPSESFAEYEEVNKKLLEEEKMSINDYPEFETNLPTKVYEQHGWLYQIIEIDGKYISAGSEIIFSEEEKEGLKVILNSLSF